ncbi:MAG: hypothetical protein ABSA48_09590 [Terracidiphilus sp.]|jgi:hypothetical protein
MYGMKAIHWILMLFSIIVCAACLVAINKAGQERVGLPDYYRELDTSLPFNDLARKSLDLRISNAEYDAIRWQYFEDRVAPRFSVFQEAAAWEDFKGKTERPDSPGRQKTLRDYIGLFESVFGVCVLYIFFNILRWIWLRVLVPAKKIVQENGIYGLIRLILFGKKALSSKGGETGC